MYETGVTISRPIFWCPFILFDSLIHTPYLTMARIISIFRYTLHIVSWKERMNISISDTGNAMNDDEILRFDMLFPPRRLLRKI